MSKKFSKSYIVCECKQVSLGEIIYAIEKKGAKTLEDLEALTDAGSSCGSCKSPQHDIKVEKTKLYLVDILKKFIKE